MQSVLPDYNNLKFITGKYLENSSNTWRLNNAFLSKPRYKEDIWSEIRKQFELNKNKNPTHQNVGKATKVVHTEKQISSNPFIREENYPVNDLCFHVKKWEKNVKDREWVFLKRNLQKFFKFAEFNKVCKFRA